MMKYILIITLIGFCFLGQTQQPIAEFPFDCNLIDQTGNYNDFISPTFPGCECGIDNDAVEITNSVDLVADTSLSSIFNGDFGISFYFQSQISIGSQELLSLGNNCSSDSTFRFYYLDGVNEIVFEISESIQESLSLRGTLPIDNCWNHVAVSRANNNYTLYINGEIADNIEFANQIFIDQNEPLKIGHGPCVGVISNEFNGLIDKLQIFQEEIQAFRARELYIPNNEVVNNDTTIFEGDIIPLNAVENCGSTFQWTPTLGIDDPSSFNTSVEGIQTTQYIASFTSNGCTTLDTFNLFIVDPNDIQCEDLILPNVFTPNGDGLNDSFGILNGFIVEDLSYFQIFDRWGELVFSTSNKTDRWDGNFRGSALNSSMFVYKIAYKCNGNNLVKMGNVSILR